MLVLQYSRESGILLILRLFYIPVIMSGTLQEMNLKSLNSWCSSCCYSHYFPSVELGVPSQCTEKRNNCPGRRKVRKAMCPLYCRAAVCIEDKPSGGRTWNPWGISKIRTQEKFLRKILMQKTIHTSVKWRWGKIPFPGSMFCSKLSDSDQRAGHPVVVQSYNSK